MTSKPPPSFDNSTDAAINPIKLDADLYRDDLSTLDLTDAQKDELLETLWNIMITMVDIGWGVDSVQVLMPSLFNELAPDSQNLLDSDKTKEKGMTDE